MRIGIATDHGGFGLKEELVSQLRAAGHEVVDFGAHDLSEGDDYPDYVVPLAQAVAAQEGRSWSSDLRQRRRRIGLREQGPWHPSCVNSRPFFGKAGRRGRSHEHALYGRQDCRTSRRLGSRSDVSRSRVQSSAATFASLGQSSFAGGTKRIGKNRRRKTMTDEEMTQLAINTIRTLSIDAVQQAKSGHPGTPMALAPLIYTIWNRVMRFDPEDPIWPNRDRFVLSNGHASMLLWSVLHLTRTKAVNANYERLGHVVGIS